MSAAAQFEVLGVRFIVIDRLAVYVYAAAAGSLSTWLSRRGRITTQRRITGIALIGAAGLLSLRGAPSTSR